MPKVALVWSGHFKVYIIWLSIVTIVVVLLRIWLFLRLLLYMSVMAQACCIFPMPAKVTFQAKIDWFVFLPVVPAMAGSAPRLSKWTVKTTQQRQNTESQFWKLHSAVGPLCFISALQYFPLFFYRSVFVFDKIDLNTSVFVLCSLVKVQVSGERLDSLEMPGHQVMFRFLPKFQKFISSELNIKDFLQLPEGYCLHIKCSVM